MIQDTIHKQIMDRCDLVTEWFEKKSAGLKFPFYSSFDIRDSGEKVSPVDANIFPAGFNNICHQDKEAAVAVVQGYLSEHYPQAKSLGLLTEEHTNNPYYWQNVLAIQDLLRGAGYEVSVALPREMPEPADVASSSGATVRVHGSVRREGNILINGHTPDLLICNNDFSESYEDWGTGLQTPMNPPRELGWYRRRKDQFFSQYNQLAGEFAELIAVDSLGLQISTERFDKFDITSDDSRKHLADQVDAFLGRLRDQYRSHGIQREPFAFVKNNAGTYGLAVIRVGSGAEVLDWNYKSRKKMKAAKGGRNVTSLIIQEGVPTRFKGDGESAEPCIYVVGSELVGGFLRTHSQKSDEDSLNSPGAVYKRLCMSDMAMDLSDCPMETVYGWISKLAVLAVANEARAGNVEFKNYN